MAGRKGWSDDAVQAEGEVETSNDVWWKADEDAMWMILSNDGLQSIHRPIDNAAMLMYSAGHEPGARKHLAYWTLGCRMYKHACRGAFMFDDVFRTPIDW